MAKDKRIGHPLAYQLYNYVLGRRFDPGAQAESFEARFELPAITFRGAARLAGALRVTQHPQVWFVQQTGIQGLGGVQAGQVILQPLLDPSTLNQSD